MPLRDVADRYPEIVKRLGQARLHQRVAHAYLFGGDNQDALAAVARSWAQVCACGQTTASGDACGDCRTCRQIAAGSYPNLRELKPHSKARWIRVDDVRELERFINLKTTGGIKIGMIYDAHRMNIETQNAFLKTLEEPAPKTLLILISTMPGALLPTILSRCQPVSLLDNRVDYALEPQSPLLAALRRMRKGAGALVAVSVTEQVLSALAAAKEEAEAEAKEHRARAKADNVDLDPALKKRIDEEIDAMAASTYLLRRETVLSVLHTWFAMEYLRSAGVSTDLLPNQELYQAAPAESVPEPPCEAEARRALDLSETLLENMHYNVNEELAIQDFCQRVCAKN